MDGTSPDISVVMVSYGSSAHVQTAVAALLAQTEVSLEIIVVDNASPDHDADNLTGLPINLVRSEKNLGYGLGINLGAQKASGKYLCVLNPDVIPPPDCLAAWLREARKITSTGQKLGCLAPRLTMLNGNPQKSVYAFMTPLNYWSQHSVAAGALKWIRKRWRGAAPPPTSIPRPVDWVMGAAMLFPREAFEAVSGFSPGYFLYAEDMDICRRLKDAGFPTWFTPEVTLPHALGESSPEPRDVSVERLYRGLLTFLHQHYTPLRSIPIRACMVADMVLRIILVAGPAAVLRKEKDFQRLRGYRRVLQLKPE
jgi:GT2 family glycosyltransferase